MASIIPPPNKFLWCNEHAEIAAWMAENNLDLEFYGSFLNYCARTVDKLRRGNNRVVTSHLKHLRETLSTEPLSESAVLGEMKYFHRRFYPTGPVLTGAYPLNALLNNPDHVHRAHHYLYSKVFGRQHACPFSSPARAIAGNTLAVVNGATAASPVSPASPAPAATPQQPGLLDQRPLPGGSLLGTLPIREQPLAVASLETSLPAMSAAAAPSAPPEQQAREHGALLLLGGQEQEALEEVQDEDDVSGVEL